MFTFGARGNGHDDYVALLITGAMADISGALRRKGSIYGEDFDRRRAEFTRQQAASLKPYRSDFWGDSGPIDFWERNPHNRGGN
jgi:hypothetical protein